MSTYSSKYTNRKIGAPNRLAEFVCENQAAKKNVVLPYRFWSTSKTWEREFKRQIMMARQLVDLYGEETMMHVIYIESGKRILSWYFEPVYAPIIRQAQDELRKREKMLNTVSLPDIPNTTTIEKPRQAMINPNSIRNKLKALDGEED